MSVESNAVKPAARAPRKHSSETKEKVRAWAPVDRTKSGSSQVPSQRRHSLLVGTSREMGAASRICPNPNPEYNQAGPKHHACGSGRGFKRTIRADDALHVCGQFKGILRGSADGRKAIT